MATIYHRYERGDSTFICPQKKEITQESTARVARRLSGSFERYAIRERRRSSAISERNSIADSIHSLKSGKLPTNAQLIRITNGLLYSSTIEYNKKFMSVDGQILLQDFQKLVIALQDALKNKNSDELFQSMIYHVRQSELSTNSVKPENTDQIKSELKSGARAVYKISKLLLFNSKFRALLMDMLSIAQQTLGAQVGIGDDSTTKTTTSDHIMDKNSYQAPQSNQTEKNTLIGHNAGNPSVILAPHTDIISGAGSSSSIPVHEQIKLNTAHDTSVLGEPSARDAGGVDASTNTDPLSISTKNSEINNSSAEQNAGMSTKEIVARLKEIFTTMQQNPQYQRAISTIFSLFKMWSQRVTDTTNERRGSMGDDNYATTAAKEAKTIIEDWAQGKSLDPIIGKAYELSYQIKQDPELSQLYEKVCGRLESDGIKNVVLTII